MTDPGGYVAGTYKLRVPDIASVRCMVVAFRVQFSFHPEAIRFRLVKSGSMRIRESFTLPVLLAFKAILFHAPG